jgi:hypothetical protein
MGVYYKHFQTVNIKKGQSVKFNNRAVCSIFKDILDEINVKYIFMDGERIETRL